MENVVHSELNVFSHVAGMVPKQTYEGQTSENGNGLALRYLRSESICLHHECRSIAISVSVCGSGFAESSDITSLELLRQFGSAESGGGLHPIWLPQSLETWAKE